MTDKYIELLEKELIAVLKKNLGKLRLPSAVKMAEITVKKYFENLM